MQEEVIIGRIASKHFLTCSPDTTIREAAERMSANRFSPIIVLESGKAIGVWTERDAVGIELDRPQALDQPISSVLSAPVISAPSDTPLEEATLQLRQSGIRHIVVTDEAGLPCGLLSHADLLAASESAHPKNIQQALREQVNRVFGSKDFSLLMGKVFESASEAIVVTDKAGTIQAVNPAFCRITGYSPQEAIGQNPRILKSDRHGAEFYRHMWAMLEEHGQWRGELWNRRKSSEIYLQRASLLAIRNDDGEIAHYVGIAYDATEERNARDALRASEERYRLLVEHSPDGILIHHKGIIEFANPAASAITGARNALDLVGRNILEFVHSDSRDAVLLRQKELQHTRTVPMIEEGLLRVDGTPFHAEVTASSFDSGNRRLVQVVFRDVTSRKRAESALQESEERLSLVVRGTSDGIWDWDIEKDSVYFSPRFRELLGYENEAEFRQSFLFRESLHPDDRDRTVASVYRTLGGGPPFNESYRLRLSNGSYGWFRGRGLALRHSDGKAYRFAGSLTDMNEIKQSELLLAAERRVFEQLAAGTELPRIFDMLCRDLETILPIESHVSLQLLEGGHLRHGSAPSIAQDFKDRIDALVIGAHSGTSGQAAHQKARIIAADIGIDPAWKDLRELALVSGFHACWSTPVVAGDEVLGTITVYHDIPHVPGLREMQVVDRFVHLSRMLIEDNRTQANLQLASSVIEHGSEGVMITDAQSRILRVNEAFCRITGYSQEEVIGLGPSILNSGRHDAAFYQAMWHQLKETGQWRGEIWNRRKNGEIYPEWLTISAIRNEKGIVTHYAALFSDVTEQKATEARIHRLAFYDALTGLPNRPMLDDHLRLALSSARRQQNTVALMFLDLDHFKQINDSLGHGAGDQLLKEAAQRLLACVREGDTVARMGGDEFVILLPDCGDISHGYAPGATQVAEKIRQALSRPILLTGHEVAVTSSIGIALYPSDALNAADLGKHADIAMYHAKSQGRNNYQFYTVEMNEALMERLTLERAMRKAIEEEQFQLFYQPRIDVASGRIVGLEALIRWKHPVFGFVSPVRFISLAEESGHILAIGEWILKTASRQCKEWVESGLWNGLSTLAINVSPRQFQQSGFVEMLHEALAWSGLAAKYLEVEVTESTLMHGVEPEDTLIRLRELGVQVAIDDFGTGYSSLSYLKRFPLDVLKIDQSFVRDLRDDANDASIILAIISMAKNLNLRVIAEGVETVEQFAFLKAHGCDECQGYLFSKPQPAEAISQILAIQAESGKSRAA